MTRASTLLRDVLTLPAGRRSKWVLVVLWLVVAALTGPFAGKLPKVESNNAIAYLPVSAQSTKVNNALAQFPGGQEVPGAVVYVTPGGAITAADREVVANQRSLAAQRVPDFKPQAIRASRDGKALSYSFFMRQPDATKLTEDIKAVRKIVSGGPGLKGYVTGAAGLLADTAGAFKGVSGILLVITGLVVIVLLLLIYRSPVLWLAPLLSVVGAIGLAEWAVYQLAQHAGVIVSGESGGILTVLVFGAGTDYALLLTARYREELRRHEDHHEAMRAALQRVSRVILASASTVVLGLLCLLAAKLNSESGLGPIGAVGIVSALLAQLTFLPALLVVLGRRLFWPAQPAYQSEPAEGAGFWAKAAKGIISHPRPIWVGTASALLVASVGLVWFDLGLRPTQAFVNTPPSVAGQRLYAEHFPAGGGEPVIVVADASKTGPVLHGVQEVRGVTRAFPVATASGQVEILAVLSSAPDSGASYGAIRAIRANVAAVPNSHALVGGNIATTLDTDNAATTDRYVVMPLVLLVVMMILGILLRAIVAPVLLVLTVVLSFAATMGVSSLAFHAFGFAGVDQTVPLLAFIFLVALGVDYNIFLVSRIREEALVRGTRDGTAVGVGVTGGVITSAGIVLAATFSALAILPLVALVEISFIVAFGVLLDTLVVRSVLVPALVTDIGKRIWWPSALARTDGAGGD